MGDDLKPIAKNLLTWFITFCVALLVGGHLYMHKQFLELERRLPHEYVQAERYGCDQKRIETTLEKLDNKIDRLLMKTR